MCNFWPVLVRTSLYLRNGTRYDTVTIQKANNKTYVLYRTTGRPTISNDLDQHFNTETTEDSANYGSPGNFGA